MRMILASLRPAAPLARRAEREAGHGDRAGMTANDRKFF